MSILEWGLCQSWNGVTVSSVVEIQNHFLSLSYTHNIQGFQHLLTTDANISRCSLFFSQPPCCSRMIWRTALHYALFWLILALTSGQLTDEQKAQIVDLHNQYRSSVNPTAGNMQRMVSTEHTCTNMSADGMLAVQFVVELLSVKFNVL